MARSSHERERLIAQYAAGPARLRAAFAGVPDPARQWRPAPGEWSAHEVVCHCADSESNAALRIRYLVVEAQPLIVGYDENAWARTLDYDRVLPLVVEVSGRIIADATLHHRRQGWRRHLGGVRVVVDPEFRHRGLASRLIHELADLAAREGLVRLYVELPADDKPALELFRARGFKEVAGFKDHILDLKGKFHDLVVLHMDLVYRD